MLASLLNPYGYRLHVHVAQYLGASFYLQHVSEFQSIDFHSFTAAYFETLLVLAIAAALWHLGSGRLVHVMLLLSWSHLALFSARNIPIFAVVTAPSIGLAMREWLERAGSLWPTQWMGKLAGNLEELETGLRTIATTGNRKHWHLVPCFVVLLLAFLLGHPGRAKSAARRIRPQPIPRRCGGDPSPVGPRADDSLVLELAVGRVFDIPPLAFDQRLRRWSNGFLRPCFRGRGVACMGSSSRLGTTFWHGTE